LELVEQIQAGTRIGHYLLAGKIGAGGMGEVYRAQDLSLDRPVAIKFLPAWAADDPTAVERLVREAKLASALNHPHIVTIYAIEQSDSLPFLVMEYVEGETLRDRLARKPLEIAELAAVGAEVADALESAHRIGLIHRDIKSTNILITADGHAKVVDFGLAKRLPSFQPGPDETALKSLTATGALVGTAAYMSPEQTRGEPLDPRTDLFSLGVVLYEAATGRLPFEGPTMLSVLHEIALVEPPAPSRARPGLPRALDQVLLRAMAKDKARRFSSAAELAAALRALAREDGALPADIADGAAASRAPSRLPNNLPVALTSFVGRRDEMEEIARLLGTARLVTLTGAGGCGKSRLSVQVARNILESFPDGAWIAELAPLTDPGLVAQRVAAALGVREEAGRPIMETLREALGARTLLILLDNCEHLTDACRSLAAGLLEGAPGVRILATSREALGVAGEVVWRVPPLHVPDLRGPGRLTRREIGRFESVRLFAERATAAAPNFSLTDQNADTVAQICSRLDGIPLAIELAAARVKVLPVNQILTRLEDRFRLLTSGSPTALMHQQTLRATVEWSYDLLSEKERTLFDRLSVFAGGASLEAVESVCAGESLAEAEILDLLTHLIDKSLVVPEEGVEGAARYRMLETLREYGREALEGSGGKPGCLERHAAFYLALAEEAEPELTGSDQSAWLARLEQEHDNLRRAAEWAILTAHRDEALRLAGSLWRFWRIHGHFDEGRRRLDAALALDVRADASGRHRAKALLGAGALARNQSDYERARVLLEESLALLRANEDLEGIGAALQEIGNVADDQGRHDDALARYQESLAIRRRLGDRIGEAALLHNLGVVAQARGDHERARSLYRESLAIKRELGNEAGEANTLNALGSVDLDLGDFDSAKREHEQALALHRRLRHRGGIAYSLHELGRVAIAARDFNKARAFLCESLPLFEELGDRIGVAETLEHFAVLAIEQGAHAAGLELAGAASALREQLGAPATPTDRSRFEAQLSKAREALGDPTSEAHLRDGVGMAIKDALALATRGAAGPTGTQPL
jgi:non-specific serine/threonine protein kinase